MWDIGEGLQETFVKVATEIKRVDVVVHVGPNVAPQGVGLLREAVGTWWNGVESLSLSLSLSLSHLPQVFPLLLTVAKKGAKLARKEMIMKDKEKELIELKHRGKLNHYLPHTLQELCKNWRGLAAVPSKMATPK